MEFSKQDRMRSILMELVSQFVRQESNTHPLITITRLTLSANSHDAIVFFTTIPDTGQDESLIFLRRKGTELRNYIKKHGRLKFVPHFNFEVDYGERNRQHIDELSQEINEENKE